MKVLIVCGSALPEINGGTTNVRERVSLLSKWGHEVLILAPDYSILGVEGGAYPHYRDHLGEIMPNVTVAAYPSRHAWIDVTLFPQVFAFDECMDGIRAFGPDVISVESPERLFWGFLQNVGSVGRTLGVPSFAVHHANYVAIAEGAGKHVPILRMPGPVWFMKQVTAHVYNQFDRTLVHADAAIDYLAKYGVPAEKVTQCPFLGVNTTRFTPPAARPAGKGRADPGTVPPALAELCALPSARGASAPASAPVVFMYVGRLSEEKQIHVLVSAYRTVVASLDGAVDTRLVIVGGGDAGFTEELHELAEGTGALLPGPVPNDKLQAVYALCDVFVTPSPCESAGLTVLEACASGVPVLGADAGGVGELVNDDVGRKFPPGDSAALAGHMAELAQDAKLRARLAGQAVAYAERNSIVEATRRMVTIWEDAVTPAKRKIAADPVRPTERLPMLLAMLALCIGVYPLMFPTTVAGVLLLAAYATLISNLFSFYRRSECCWCRAPFTHLFLAGSLGALQLFIEVLWRLVRLLGVRKRKPWETPYLVTIKGWIGLGDGGKAKAKEQ